MDTGAPFLIIEPAVADRLGLDPEHNSGDTTVKIRGDRFQGYLERVDIQLPALSGTSIKFEATAFILKPTDVEKWDDLPTFLGIESCLENIRFALDPTPGEFKFYFGYLPERLLRA
jgi:hypothetical protein